jgi:NAD(P)-dependent dehydrogenase (short-subunit alcohol dehydrogenase family)
VKHALVWGAAGGIGKALTRKLVDQGYTVVAISRHPVEMKALTPHSIATDVTNPSQVRAAAYQARTVSETFELFAYTAGDIASIKTEDMKVKDWERLLGANLTGAYLTVQASLPLLIPEAKLFFMGAVHERMRLPGLGVYAAAKAGLEAFAESLRRETRLKVLIARPGAVNTALWEKVPFSLPKNALEPEDFAERVLAALDEGQNGLLEL